MTDPLNALRLPAESADPDPDFAARLRARLQRELLNPPRGTTVTTTAPAPTTAAENTPLHSLTPYTCVSDARAALEFYVSAFGARRRGEPYVMDDGRIGHVEVAIGDSILMFADEFAEIGLLGPLARGGVSQSLHLRVVDPDSTVDRAVHRGAELNRPVADQPYGRGGVVTDPFGHRWQVMRAEGSSLHSLTPRLTVSGARAALEFYDRAFGAQRRGESYVEDDGRIGHAELVIGDSVVMVADEWPEEGLLGPPARSGVSQSLNLQVADPDATVQRAVELGAALERPVADQPYGRSGVVTDPFGHRWIVMGGALRLGRSEGDLGYASLWVPDVGLAATFFSAVLGWSYYGHGPEHRMVEGADPHHGIVELSALPAGLWDTWPRHATLFASHAVADVEAAVGRVRAAGGQATAPHEESFGRTAECLDDQGMPFAVYQDTPAAAPAASPGDGQIAYLTFEVPDSARARAFFGAVFGWSFTPGRVADGWQIEGMTRMGGISGGHAEPTIVPMYAVDDIAGTVARVREAGGTATDPEAQPYGTTSFCADDQGTRFHLGELG
jgi:uncharacterized glyoxalase superfamily protein PhnB